MIPVLYTFSLFILFIFASHLYNVHDLFPSLSILREHYKVRVRSAYFDIQSLLRHTADNSSKAMNLQSLRCFMPVQNKHRKVQETLCLGIGRTLERIIFVISLNAHRSTLICGTFRDHVSRRWLHLHLRCLTFHPPHLQTCCLLVKRLVRLPCMC